MPLRDRFKLTHCLAGLGVQERAKDGLTRTCGMEAASKPITAFRKEGHIDGRGLTMSAESRDKELQFENPEVSKLEDETNEGGSPRERVDRLAEKLARKSSQVEKDSDEDQSIFTK